MKSLTYRSALLAMVVLAGCSHTMQSPDIATNLRASLNQAGLKRVTVTQDRENGVVTLGGNVAPDSEKAQAETLARSAATGQVVSNQIAASGGRRKRCQDRELGSGQRHRTEIWTLR